MPSTLPVSALAQDALPDTQSLIDTLAADPRVESVIVDQAAGTVRVRAESGWLEAECRRTGAAMAARSEQQWRSTYEKTYRAPKDSDVVAVGPNYAGWVSSYTREPIELAAMERWREECCGRMLALPHRHVLEIGCGVGLIAERVAPQAESYHGIDLSPAAITSLEAWLQQRPDLAHVTLACQPAAAGMTLPDRAFDLVIVNSVLQYFSDPERVEALIADLWGRLAPGGHLFIGDVRPHRLNNIFQGAVAAFRAAANVPVAQVRADRDAAIQSQGEFTADPGFFHALARRLGASIRVRIKDTPDHTEMSVYRYDVVLGTAPAGIPVQAEPVGAAELAARLQRGDARPAMARNVRRSRLMRDRAVVAAMSAASPLAPVSDVLARADSLSEGIDSDALRQAAAEAGVAIELTLPPDGGDGFCEAWIGTVPDAPRPDAAPLRTHCASPTEMIVLRVLWLDLLDVLGDAFGDLPGLRVLVSAPD